MILHLSEYALNIIETIITTWRSRCDSANMDFVSDYIDESLFTVLLSRIFYLLTTEDLENLTDDDLKYAIVDIQTMIYDGTDNEDSHLIADIYRAIDISETFAMYVDKDSLTKYNVTAEMISNKSISEYTYESISNILICAFAKMIVANIPDIKDLKKLVIAIINANGGNKHIFKNLARRNKNFCAQVMDWSNQGFITVD